MTLDFPRHRVKSPGVERMAAKQSPQGKPDPHGRAVKLNRFYGIGRTSGIETANRRFEPRKTFSIDPE
jgi:hypothetical protein